MNHALQIGGVGFVLVLGAIAFVLLAHFILEAAARAFKLFGWWIVIGVTFTAVLLGWGVFIYFNGIGKMDSKQLRPPVCEEAPVGTTLYHCPLMRTLAGTQERGLRLWRPITEISPDLQDLVVFLEDAKFFQHSGLDLDEISNAFHTDVQNHKLSRGASTITQQLAKNLFLNKDKSFFRKATEVPLALRMEKELSKKQILELYLNTIEWGPSLFGAEAAARTYFGHSAAALTKPEAMLLALMIPNPKELNPWVRRNSAKVTAALLKRADQMRHRWVHEHRYSAAEASAIFQDFATFLAQWSQRDPSWPMLQ